MPKPKAKAAKEPPAATKAGKTVARLLTSNRSDIDMRRFHAALDFAAMWQEFYLEINSNNTPLYRSVRQYIKKQPFWEMPLNDLQKDFITWLLGPEDPEDPAMVKEYGDKFKPQDWDKKRSDGGWYSNKALRAFSESVRQKINALEALQECGNGITINALSRISRMMEQLDKEMNGQFFAPALSLKDNMERAKFYIDQQEQLLRMLERAQDIYAKSHGINFHDMSGFEQFMAAQAMLRNTGSGGVVAQSNSEKVLGKIIEMTLEKGANHGIPIPDEMKKTAVAIVKGTPSKNERFQ